MPSSVLKAKTMELSGVERAAAIITSLNLEAATAIFKSLPDDEIAEIVKAIETIQDIPEEARQEALADFKSQLKGSDAGGKLDLRALLEKSMGAERAATMLNRSQPPQGLSEYFEFLNKSDAVQAYEALREERPQTLALVLCHLEFRRAAEILGRFESGVQSDVVMRMGRMQPVAVEVAAKVATALRKKLSLTHASFQSGGGAKRIAGVLNHLDRGIERQLLEVLQTRDAGLVDDVKKLMLEFESLESLSAQAMQAVLREIEVGDLCLALKGAADPLKEAVFKNLSARAAERLQEEMELQGPKPKKDIEEARQRVLAVVRRLEEEGKIQISRAGEEEELVA